MKQVRTLFSLLLLINHYHEGYAQTCSDSTKKFEITKSNGTKKNTSCDWARRKPNKTSWRCKIPEVKENCPKTCTNCCQDTTEPFIIMKTGKETNCVWVAEKNTEGRCQKAPSNLNCAVTCGKCTQHPTPEPAPPTSAPSQGPTLSTEIKCLNGNPFKITLMNMGTNTAYDEVFVVAKTRWESIIKCDLSDEASIGGDWFRGNFNSNFNGAVDDVLIGYEFKHIDGFSNKLGYAGPTYIRSTGSVVSGVMVFDEDDFLSMSDENAKIVILHEIGHVLGLVNLSFTKCYSPCSPSNVYVASSGCTGASNEYDKLNLDVGPLKVDAASCGHWDESSFPRSSGSSELMTPYFESGLRQPITRVTLAALDEGATDYVIDYNAANSFSTFNSISAAVDDEEQYEVLTPTASFSLMGKMDDVSQPIVLD